MCENSLKKHEILRGYQVIKYLLDKGIKISGNHISIYYLSDSEKKVGFIVSKRYRKAVQRNRCRRSLRELYRRNKNIFPEGKILLHSEYSLQQPTYSSYLCDISKILNRNTING